jgi:hypothetical protein
MTALRLLAVLAVLSPAAAAPVPSSKSNEEPATKSATKLLLQRKVQKELKLSAEQRIGLVDGLADIDDEIDKKRNKLLRNPNLTPDVFDKLEEERHEKSEKFLLGTVGKYAPETRRRLNQINRQVRPLESFSNPDVPKTLALTDAQKKTVEKSAKELEEKITTYLNLVGNDNSDNAKEELLTFRTEQTKALVAGLTAEQKVLWTSLLGEPVKGLDLLDLWFHLLENEPDEPMPVLGQ